MRLKTSAIGAQKELSVNLELHNALRAKIEEQQIEQQLIKGTRSSNIYH